jgi:hypothetical protein
MALPENNGNYFHFTRGKVDFMITEIRSAIDFYERHPISSEIILKRHPRPVRLALPGRDIKSPLPAGRAEVLFLPAAIIPSASISSFRASTRRVPRCARRAS